MGCLWLGSDHHAEMVRVGRTDRADIVEWPPADPGLRVGLYWILVAETPSDGLQVDR